MATKAKAAKDVPFGPATKSDRRAMRSAAAAEDKMLDDIYRQGKKDGKAEAKPRRRSSSTRRRRRRPNRSLVRGAKSIAGPAAADIGSGMALVGAVFGLLLLYLVLTNATTATGILDSIRRGLLWLASPSTSIPYNDR